METNKLLKNSIIFVTVGAVAIAGIYVYNRLSQQDPSGQSNKEAAQPFYASLTEKNSDFAYAEGLSKSRKFDEAVVWYQKALEQAESAKEEGQIKYKIAQSLSEGSNPTEGIALYKEIIANENYTQTIRAYSVQQLGHLLYSINTLEVNNEVFKDEPYKSFLVNGDYSVARRKIYEYASAIYPLGIPELRIAKWYSEEILELTQNGSDNSETKTDVEEMRKIVFEKLASADKYLMDIVNDPQARSYTSEVWYRKGEVWGDLYLAGDTDGPDPEEAFKRALAFPSTGQESSAKLKYAIFLAQMYGEERAEDIKKLLNDFYATDRFINTNTVRSIRGEKDGLLGMKEDILLLANIDSNFKEFLMTLGWLI